MMKPIITLTLSLLGQLFFLNTSVVANPIQLDQNQDIFPGDFAYEALQNLSQNYGCITGYPDDTAQGERILTRYEFVAGLVSCIESMERHILEDGDFATQEEWQEMKQFLQETSSQLNLQKTHVEVLEQR